MLKKHLLTIFLLLPLVAISATALAGSTISDKRYWPGEVRQRTQITTVDLQRDLTLHSPITGQRHVCSPRLARMRSDPQAAL